jgi:DNA-binding HxlR family transcriptional regulator
MADRLSGVKKAPFPGLVRFFRPGEIEVTALALIPAAQEFDGQERPMANRNTMTGSSYDASCPTRQVLDRIGDKWTVLVLILLVDGPVRFNELRRRIGGVSQKMLSQTLKSMERDGLVQRRAIATVPVTVEYSVTPLGLTLATLVDQVRLWAESNLGQVMTAQRRYDAATAKNAMRSAA